MSKYSIGLDLGINNVGWAIVDIETNQIEKCGVKKFNSSSGAKDRREQRNARRRLKRKDTRKKDLLNLFDGIDFPNINTIDSKLIETRVKGIREKIDKQDIVNILCYLVTHRGYIPFGDEEVNFVDLGDKLPCEYYYDLYKNSLNNKYRALRETVKNSDNEKEIRKLLEVQRKYYPELDEKFENALLGENGIFTRKRKFWEGPGSINSWTSYGRFSSKEDVDNYILAKKENPRYEKYLFEDLIGKCAVYLNERCASTGNFYAEEFNLLNDFINISFKNIEDASNQEMFYKLDNNYFKLTREGLELVFNYCINNTNVSLKNLLKNLFNVKIENISGYKTDDKNKPKLATMNIYRSMKKIFIDNNANLDIFNLDEIDNYNKIIYYMQIVPGNVELINMVSSFRDLSNNDVNALTKAMKTNKTNLKYHALSEKALKRAINDMLKECKNYMYVYKKHDYEKELRKDFIDKYKKFNEDASIDLLSSYYVDGIIASPQVKKTLRQSIKIINSIIKEKGSLPETIVIESAKETLNGDKKKAEYIKIRDLNTKNRKEVAIYLENKGLLATDKNIEKAMLWNEFDGNCAYCNKPVDFVQFINGSIEVEHILPISCSGDDSYENKTVACAICNKSKSNKTPLQYLSSSSRDSFIKRIEGNKKISDIKKQHFLYADDISKYKIRFFNRNLRDTAYATKELVNQINIFNNYLKYIYNDKNNKINTMSTPGQFTSNIRKRYNLDKDRDAGEQPYHHAVDASILALLPTTKLGKFIIRFQNDPKFFLDLKLDGRLPSEVIEQMSFYSINKNKIEFDDYINDLKKITDENVEIFKYSDEVNKDINKELSKANIIKVIYKGDNYFQISQVDNIYDAKIDKKLFDKLFDDTKNETLLCQDANINLYNYLKNIYEKYKDCANPFLEYCMEVNNLSKEDSFDYLKHGIKSSNNGPIVKKLRYYIAINNPYFLEKKNIKKKENTKISLDGLNQLCTRIYYNETKNCFTFLPIPAICTDLKFGKINKKHQLYKNYYQRLIGEDKVKHIVDLYNGNRIEVYKKSGEVIKGEVSGYDKTNDYISLKNGKHFTKSDKKLILYDVDPLGNEKIRLTFEIK